MKINMCMYIVFALIEIVATMAVFSANLLKNQHIVPSITGGVGMVDKIPGLPTMEECGQMQHEIDVLFEKESMNASDKARLEELIKKEKPC